MRVALAPALALCALSLVSLRAQEPSIEVVLDRFAIWIEDFQRQTSGLVAEELYEQRTTTRTTSVTAARTLVEPSRRLRSDFLLVRPMGSERYVEFRDVFEVDGRPVRDREERLTRLFADPSDAAGTQLQTIIMESARYNLGRIIRNVNTPLLPLMFFQAWNQPRFAFTRIRSATPAIEAAVFMGGRPSPTFRATPNMWVINYEERHRPTFIKSPQGAELPVQGRVWLNPDDGSPVMTELRIDIGDVRTLVDVTYQSEPVDGFVVPSEMRERYTTRGETIEGHATYGRIRKFQVEVDQAIDLPALPR